MPDAEQPNILVIWGDDIGITNLSCYSDGMMGYRTPNIDRIAEEGMRFTDSYAEQSCTAGRSSFITGQSVFRTGLSKVGVPGSTVGLKAEDPTIAELLKPLGYATGQFGKNHLGDRNEYLARRRNDAVPQREEHQLGGPVPRPGDGPRSRRGRICAQTATACATGQRPAVRRWSTPE